MDSHSDFVKQHSKNHFDLDKICPPARSKTVTTKIYCNSIPAIVGPWRGRVRAWHAPGVVGRTEQRKGEHLTCGATAQPVHAAALFTGPALTVSQLRAALRQERQMGIAGHSSYSLTRHHDLHAALNAAAGTSAKAPAPAERAKTNATRIVRARSSLRQSQLMLH